ncbi:MAG: squalene/phytoene synthase family protein [Alphaproteobacteria bacterium]
MVKGDQFEVEKIVKNSASSFYWGMKILPNKQARAMFAVYAFCRIVDDIADDIKSKIKREKLLKEWELSIKNLFLKQITKNSVERELLFSIKEFNLEKKDFLSIIEGMRMDSNSNIVFPSQKKLNLYCDRVAVAVGYLSIKIFGLSKSAKNYAFFLGRAFQLTNIVRDFHEDIDRGRCYISEKYLQRYQIEKNLKKIKNNPYLQKIFQDILMEAETYFQKSLIESKNLDKKKIIASEIMKLFYKKIHKKMFKKHININKRIKLSIWDKISIFYNFYVRKVHQK